MLAEKRAGGEPGLELTGLGELCIRCRPSGSPAACCWSILTSILRKFSDSMIDAVLSDVVI